jgi:hypothetical protein
MANQFSGSIAIAFTALLNLQLNLCLGVHGSWQLQHLPNSLGLIGMDLLAGLIFGSLGCGAGGCGLDLICGVVGVKVMVGLE